MTLEQPEEPSTRPLDPVQFFSEVADIDSYSMTTERLKAFVERVELSDRLLSLINKHICYKPDRLGMKRMVASEFLSISVVSLLPGQKSDVHRHAHSLEVSLVLQGKLRARLFRFKDQQLVLDREEEVGAGQITCTERYQYHQIIACEEKTICLPFHTPSLPNK